MAYGHFFLGNLDKDLAIGPTMADVAFVPFSATYDYFSGGHRPDPYIGCNLLAFFKTGFFSLLLLIPTAITAALAIVVGVLAALASPFAFGIGALLDLNDQEASENQLLLA